MYDVVPLAGGRLLTLVRVNSESEGEVLVRARPVDRPAAPSPLTLRNMIRQNMKAPS
jgi:hypothetical protein